MTTLKEDNDALCARAREEKVILTTSFYDGKFKVLVGYVEGKVVFHSGCPDFSETTMAAVFDPALLLALLPEITYAINKGLLRKNEEPLTPASVPDKVAP